MKFSKKLLPAVAMCGLLAMFMVACDDTISATTMDDPNSMFDNGWGTKVSSSAVVAKSSSSVSDSSSSLLESSDSQEPVAEALLLLLEMREGVQPPRSAREGLASP